MPQRFAAASVLASGDGSCRMHAAPIVGAKIELAHIERGERPFGCVKQSQCHMGVLGSIPIHCFHLSSDSAVCL